MLTRSICIALVGLSSLALQAQQSLSELVKEARADWMFGRWEAETDSGDKVQLNVSWDLEKNVAILHVKTGEMEHKGYTYIEPGSSEAKWISFDNRGSVGKGTWGMESEELVLRTETQTDRGARKVAFVFTGSASEGLQIRMHGIESSGDLSERKTVFKFKKQK